jgi:hypothetical protein
MSSKLFVAKGKKVKSYSLKAFIKKINSQLIMTRVFTSKKEAKKFINRNEEEEEKEKGR